MTIASLGSRMQALQGRLTDAYERISDRTDKLIARVDQADTNHANAVNLQNQQLDMIDKGVSQIESLARQMSNDPFQQENTTPHVIVDANGIGHPG